MFMESSDGARLRHDNAPLSALGASLHRVVRTVAQWLQRRRSRQALRACDDRLLRDVGLTRAQADREAAVPFWR